MYTVRLDDDGWVIYGPPGVERFDPEAVRLVLINCTLVNLRTRARRFWLRGRRGGTGWVQCEQFLVVPEGVYDGTEWAYREIEYDTRLRPHWCDLGQVVDGRQYPVLRTRGRALVVAQEAHFV
jgi:hypothetical protein